MGSSTEEAIPNAAVARADIRAKKQDGLDLPSDEHVLWASFWMVELYLSTHALVLKKGFARRLGWALSPSRLRSLSSRNSHIAFEVVCLLDAALVPVGPGVVRAASRSQNRCERLHRADTG